VVERTSELDNVRVSNSQRSNTDDVPAILTRVVQRSIYSFRAERLSLEPLVRLPTQRHGVAPSS
jgi:hypothetical protein